MDAVLCAYALVFPQLWRIKKMDKPGLPTIDSKPATTNGRKDARSVARISSSELFANRDRIIIEHSGEEYVLRITRSGKLILTK